jgi:manganese oxidase
VFWLYHSHADELQDVASGLFGGIIVTRRGMARSDGDRKKFVPYTPAGMAGTVVGTGFPDTNIKWSINGYIFGNMPLMTMKQGDRVRWCTATLGDFNNAHTPHWHGNTVLVAGQRTDVLVVTSAQMVTADMVPDAPGIWLCHCHISDHMLAGMSGRYGVKPR